MKGDPVPESIDSPVAPTTSGGILQARTAWSLMDAVMIVLVVASVVRYLINHGVGDLVWVVLPGAALLLAFYLSRRLLPPALHVGWLIVVTVVWLILVFIAPSFGWCVVVLAFAALRTFSAARAVAVIAVLILGVITATLRISDRFDPILVAGPICLAVLAVATYRALDSEATRRQRLLDDLLRTQDSLADAERTAGALAERQRLSREIHDSVTQDLTSVSLLLAAAVHQWVDDPDQARGYVRQAAESAREGLVEARGLVSTLSRPAVRDGTDLPRALERIASTALSPGTTTTVHVEGVPRPVPDQVAAAVVRTAKGALANVVEHAGASRAVLTLTYLPTAVSLDVRDDGRGFVTHRGRWGRSGTTPGRGFGLSGIQSRAQALGGSVTIESAPGDGTALAVLLPTARVEVDAHQRFC
jgi:signal transduction histidine kinase